MTKPSNLPVALYAAAVLAFGLAVPAAILLLAP